MNKQREKKAYTVDQIAGMFGIEVSPRDVASGGQFEHFREAWAIDVFANAMRGHYFRRSLVNIGLAKSLCGVSAPVKNMYGLGSIEKCKHCLRMKIGRHV